MLYFNQGEHLVEVPRPQLHPASPLHPHLPLPLRRQEVPNPLSGDPYIPRFKLCYLKAHDAEVKDTLIFRIVGSVKSWTMVICMPCTQNMNPRYYIVNKAVAYWNDMQCVCYTVNTVPPFSNYEPNFPIKDL